jgi:hypothetical protein
MAGYHGYFLANQLMPRVNPRSLRVMAAPFLFLRVFKTRIHKASMTIRYCADWYYSVKHFLDKRPLRLRIAVEKGPPCGAPSGFCFAQAVR